jgi:hypothetical protein
MGVASLALGTLLSVQSPFPLEELDKEHTTGICMDEDYEE